MGGGIVEALDTWFAAHTAGRRPATLRHHRDMRRLILSHWPVALDAPLSALTAANVSDFVLRIAHYCPSKFNAAVAIVRGVIGDFAGILKSRRVTPKEVRLPSQAEFTALLRELDRCKHGHSGLVIRFLALTGLRIGEARRLTWDCVTPRGLLIPGASTKNGRPRLIPYIGDLESVLNRLRAAGAGDRLLPQGHCRNALRHAAKRAGLATVPTHHDMRRLFATRAIECGVDLPTAARWLGHSDGGALLGRTYFHLLDSHSAAMARRVQIAA